jgi:diguanylate cyclase (GGDEF)-like protein
MSAPPHRSGRALPIILTRWVLLITISYAIIFSSPAPAPLWPHQVFIMVLLTSNLVFSWLLARARSWAAVSGWAAGIDIATVSMAMSVAGNVSFEFYIVFFSVLILAAVITGRELLVALSVVASLAYGALMWAELGGAFWRSPELLVRLPVLLGVGLYFGTAVQTARREQQRQAEQLNLERRRALAALTQMGNVAFSGGYPGPVLYELAGWVQELVEFDRCSLLVFSEGGQHGYLAASGDDPSVEVLALALADYPELGPVLERGEFTEIHPGEPPDLWRELSTRLPEGSRFQTFIVVPIQRGGTVTGAFYLRDSDPERTLSEAQRAFCSQAAQMAAAFIYEHDLLDTLSRRSQQDPLTGLMSYRSFLDEAEASIAAAGRNGRLSMAVVNIDGLSDVNKKYGHQTGTDLITHIGRRLVAGLEGAAICRYGGDEFVVLLPGDAEAARRRLQGDFLDRLGESAVELPVAPRASVGISSTPDHGASSEHLFEAARAALRVSKGAGGHLINVAGAA